MKNYNSSLKLMLNRQGYLDEEILPLSSIDGINHQAKRLRQMGGMAQQDRMIRDKQRTLEKSVMYSYQGAFVRKVDEEEVARALINPDKLKRDYDDKIISIDYQYDFKVGDVFEWLNTNTYWLINLQDLTELAYFRGDIRRCSYQINWQDEDGIHSTYAAVRGPVETKINNISKHGLSIDEPNYSLSILMPGSESTLKYFKRYQKFYLSNQIGEKICWEVQTVDSISVPGIIEVIALENFQNIHEDDIDNGLVGALRIKELEEKNEQSSSEILGENIIKPKVSYTYSYIGDEISTWSIDEENIKYISLIEDEINPNQIRLKWISKYSGEFKLKYGSIEKIITVESFI